MWPLPREVTLQGLGDLRVLGARAWCQGLDLRVLSQAEGEVGSRAQSKELLAVEQDPIPAKVPRFLPVTGTGVCAHVHVQTQERRLRFPGRTRSSCIPWTGQLGFSVMELQADGASDSVTVHGAHCPLCQLSDRALVPRVQREQLPGPSSSQQTNQPRETCPVLSTLLVKVRPNFINTSGSCGEKRDLS